MSRLTDESRKRVEQIASRYPHKRSALLPALYVAQHQDGRVTDEAIDDIAPLVGLTPAEVRGVATFYTMYYHEPVARHVFQVCGTLSCALCGAEELIRHLESRLGVRAGQTTSDGLFMFEVVECLGACGTAPVVLFNDKYYENLTLEQVDALIVQLRSGAGEGVTDPQLEPYRTEAGRQ